MNFLLVNNVVVLFNNRVLKRCEFVLFDLISPKIHTLGRLGLLVLTDLRLGLFEITHALEMRSGVIVEDNFSSTVL